MATARGTVAGSRPVVQSALVVTVVGNPNVGKSSLFNCLTGACVETANYAGMTVEVASRPVLWDGRAVEVRDLPGAYAFGSGGVAGDDQRLAWRHLLTDRPDVVVAVIDATNLARNLYFVLQLIDLGYPVVVALNLMDVARRRSLHIDVDGLAAGLGVPVVPTVSSSGEGVKDLKKAVVALASGDTGPAAGQRYSAEVERRRRALSEGPQAPLGESRLPFGLSPRAAAIAVLEGIDGVIRSLDVPTEMPTGERWSLRIARERHARARDLTDQTMTLTRVGVRGSERLWRLATRPRTGLPLLLVVLASVFVVLFSVGGRLALALTALWEAGPGPVIRSAVHAVLGENAIADGVLWGLGGGVLAALAVGIPYILTFYFLLALLEDSGYMNAVAYLTDRIMHRFGLHGQAAIPLVAAAGCNVPAVIGTRVLPTRRERLIASWLITLTPCSARTAVIVGSVGLLVGWQWALGVYGVVALVAVVSGMLLNRVMGGDSSALIMEMFPIRRPAMRMVVRKTWNRFREFVWVAAPFIIGGSIALGLLHETGALVRIEPVLDPVVGWWLGLPAVAGITLIFAILRKELALQLLVVFAVAAYGASATDLRSFMTGDQIVVYALVNAIYVPCIATIAVLSRELGRSQAALICLGTVVTALAVGGAANLVLQLV